ncbi:MAG: bifunctional (p)ppGpp synthetase/guanosine-3',5'-bis(diphosphate) 3'-pyrophosphohydrolase [bacterium]|nr:bifunctional (p)ppGpp synthetase/guanosine-3',5'-bis(diphosphate) 3'-pyrophosphohydrolase [bacterium]
MSLHGTADGSDLRARMEQMCARVKDYNPQADEDHLWDGYEFASRAHAGQKRKSGEPFFQHALTVADILTDLRLDVDTLIAAMVHDVVEDTDHTLADIEQRFGADVAHMVDGVTKISGIRAPNRDARKAETYRKLVLAIAQDPRTVLIKLADRLHNMRTIQYLDPDRQRDIAQETMDVYAPLAHRFGIARIKWELEDLSFKVLQPERYFEVEAGIKQTRAERERLIERLSAPLRDALGEAGIRCQLTGRPKHFYSIYRKMKDQEIGMERVFDLLAVRIITETKADCYHALGVLHSHFPPLADRIKDYIATPKPNMYQSIHSTVRVPGSKYIEVQIRTGEMHERAELGIAAHWRYKEGGGADKSDLAGMVNWLRQIMEWEEDVDDAREFMETLKFDFFSDEVFVFSPGGDVFQLPRGATPLDFAFRIHSEVGFRCIGAKVNGRIVSLRGELHNGDTVEILTAKQPSPSASWLEIVKTSRAKHHLRRWIKTTQYEESLRLGREILERELRRARVRTRVDGLVDLAQQMGYTELDKLLAAVGRGEITPQKVVARVTPPPESAAEKVISRGKELYDTLLRRASGGVKVAGVDNLMVSFARCCQPIPGDGIVGIITRGRGVSVHRVGCTNLNDPNLGPERLIDVTWDTAPEQVFMVKLIIQATDRKNLLMDLSNTLAVTNTNIASGEFGSETDFARITLVVEVRNLNKLEKIIKALQKVRGVEKIERFQLGQAPG